MQTVQLKVAGMSCSSCIRSVTAALLKVSDVSAVEVDLPRGIANVTTRSASMASVPAMVEALSAAGYEASPVSAPAFAVEQGTATQSHANGCGQGGAGPRRAGGCCCS